VIISVVIPLLTGNVQFDVQEVQADHAIVPTVFKTTSVNPQSTSGVHMPYNWSPTTATTAGVHMPSGYGTANTNNKDVSSTTIITNNYHANQANTANTNNKDVSSTTITHNADNNHADFGAFFQTAGKTASTAKTNNGDVAKRTATTTRDADPASTTTSTIADPAIGPGAQNGAGVVIGGTGGSLARAILSDLSAQTSMIRGNTGVENSAALHAAGTQISIGEILLSLGIQIVIVGTSICLYSTVTTNQPACFPLPSHSG
jgi:hypothetical protein